MSGAFRKTKSWFLVKDGRKVLCVRIRIAKLPITFFTLLYFTLLYLPGGRRLFACRGRLKIEKGVCRSSLVGFAGLAANRITRHFHFLPSSSSSSSSPKIIGSLLSAVALLNGEPGVHSERLRLLIGPVISRVSKDIERRCEQHHPRDVADIPWKSKS